MPRHNTGGLAPGNLAQQDRAAAVACRAAQDLTALPSGLARRRHRGDAERVTSGVEQDPPPRVRLMVRLDGAGGDRTRGAAVKIRTCS